MLSSLLSINRFRIFVSACCESSALHRCPLSKYKFRLLYIVHLHFHTFAFTFLSFCTITCIFWAVPKCKFKDTRCHFYGIVLVDVWNVNTIFWSIMCFIPKHPLQIFPRINSFFKDFFLFLFFWLFFIYSPSSVLLYT